MPFTLPHPHSASPDAINDRTDDDDHSLLTETESEIDLDEDMPSIASSLADRLT